MRVNVALCVDIAWRELPFVGCRDENAFMALRKLFDGRFDQETRRRAGR
jgi:hypothetical protein